MPLLIGVPGGVHHAARPRFTSPSMPDSCRNTVRPAPLRCCCWGPRAPTARILSRHQGGEEVCDHHRQGLPARRASISVAWRLPCAFGVLDHSDLARGAAPDPAVGVVPAALYAAVARRSRSHVAWRTTVAVGPPDERSADLGNSVVYSGVGSATIVAAHLAGPAWVVIPTAGGVRFALYVMVSVPLVFPGIVLGITILIEFLRAAIHSDLWHDWILVVRFPDPCLCPDGLAVLPTPGMGRSIVSSRKRLAPAAPAGFTELRRIALPLALPSVVAAWLLTRCSSTPSGDPSIRDPARRSKEPGDRGGDPRIPLPTMARSGSLPHLRCAWRRPSAALAATRTWLGRRAGGIAV